MGKYLEKAKELRAITEIHYNCAQSVICAFQEIIGVDEEILFKTAAGFAKGIRMGAACGAFTGGMMTLGLLGLDDVQTMGQYTAKFRNNHEGTLNCAELLQKNEVKGGERKPHCDALVFESVSLIEDILTARGMM